MIQLTQKEIERFRSKLSEPNKNGCRVWLGEKNSMGYGRFTIWRPNRIRFLSHRLALSLVLGREVEGLTLHSCDNPPCSEGAHLAEGTQSQNMREAKDRGRANLTGLQQWSDDYVRRARARAEEALAIGMKTCGRCQNLLPLDDFGHWIRGLDGRNGVCLSCLRQTPRIRNRSNSRASV